MAYPPSLARCPPLLGGSVLSLRGHLRGHILAILGSAPAFTYLGPSGLTAPALAAFPILHLRDAGPDRTMAVVRTFEAATEGKDPKKWLGPMDIAVRDLYLPPP